MHPGVYADRCDGVDADCDGEIDEDHKAGWPLVTVDKNADRVFAIDQSTAATSELSVVNYTSGINSMDVSENGLSVVHENSAKAIGLFDACSGEVTRIGVHGVSSIGGIGFDGMGDLYGIGDGDVLVRFDLSTGEATEVGPLGIDIGNSGLAWDCTERRMFGADASQQRVFQIDLSTAEATDIVSTDVLFDAVGIEFDHRTDLLWAANRTHLYAVDPDTGATTLVGEIAGARVDDLALHPTCP